MPSNYYAFDLIREEDGQIKILEVGGTRAAGMKFFRNAYGNPAEREVYRKFLEHLKKAAEGGHIFFNTGNLDEVLVTPREVLDLIDGKHSSQKGIQRRLQDKVGVPSPAALEEMHRFEKYAKVNGYKLRLGHSLEVFAEGEPFCFRLLRCIKDGKEAYYKISEGNENGKGTYFQKDQAVYPVAGIPVINSPAVDFSLIAKLWPALIMRECGHESYFPKQVVVGMGLCSENELREFQSEVMVVVMKPLISSNSVGVEFLDSKGLIFPREVFSSPVDIEREFQLTWQEFLQEYFYVPMEFGHHMKKPMKYLPRYKYEKMLKKFLFEQKHFRDETLDDVIGSVRYPIHELGGSIVQEYVDPEIIVKDGQPRKGYIRAYFMGGEFLGAWCRSIRRRLERSDVCNPTTEKTSFEPVADKTLEEVAAFGSSFIRDYESSLDKLGIRTIADFIRYRDSRITQLLGRKESALFGL